MTTVQVFGTFFDPVLSFKIVVRLKKSVPGRTVFFQVQILVQHHLGCSGEGVDWMLK
jgi:hypothetical protein